MDPTEQWEEASDIMNTKGNCGTILCRAERIGPRGQYHGLLAANGEGSLFLQQATDKIHQRWLNSGPLVSRGDFDLHPLKCWRVTLRQKIRPFQALFSVTWPPSGLTVGRISSLPHRGFSFTSDTSCVTTLMKKRRRKKGIKHQFLTSAQCFHWIRAGK